jgi:hypothetical protein
VAMTEEQVAALPEAQRTAVEKLYARGGYSRQEFLAVLQAPTPIANYVAVNGWKGMYVGIEEDGHTHT